MGIERVGRRVDHQRTRAYIASAAYVAFNARFRGGYRVLTSLAIGIAFSALLYAVFELAFKVPLLKGPLEPLLGIH